MLLNGPARMPAFSSLKTRGENATKNVKDAKRTMVCDELFYVPFAFFAAIFEF
jgi:hypothetical protein